MSRLHAKPKRRLRGVEFIEFAILFPIIVALLLLIFGTGELIITQIGLQASMQQFVREGAQTGGLIGCPAPGVTCSLSAPGPGYDLMQAINTMPGGTWTDVTGGGPDVIAGWAQGCTTESPWVTAKISYDPQATSSLMSIITDLIHVGNSNWTLTAEATARCDVATQ
jgi:hypothetical protein